MPELLKILFWFGAVHGLFLSIVLFVHKRGNLAANRILAVLIFTFSLRLAEFVGYWSPVLYDIPHFIFATVPFPLVFGVLIYLYARAMTGKNIAWWHTLHFLPFLAYAAYLLPFYVKSGPEKIAALEYFVLSGSPVFTTGYFVMRAVKLLHMALYSFLALKVAREQPRGRTSRIGPQQVRRSWLLFVIAGFGVFVISDFAHFLELLFFGYQFIVQIDFAVLFFSNLLIYAAGYMALRRPEIISGFETLRSGPRYKKSALSRRAAARIREKLIHCMETERPYLEASLDLRGLAEKISVSGHHLSQVLNEHIGRGFADFVNGYRIEEAKNLLLDPKASHQTILSVALDSGFNNKAPFNTAFKKHTGLTPSEFRVKSQPKVIPA